MLELGIFDTPCIDISGLKSIEERELFNNVALKLCNPISKKYIDYFNTERSNRYGFIGILPAEYAHEYHRIKPEWQRKIITVGIDDDVVIVVVKHVQMFQNVYKRLEGLPISISNNRENEVKVFDAFNKSKFFTKFLCIEPEEAFLESKGMGPDTEFETYNYHTNVPKNYIKVTKNKWMTKKGVNRLLKDPLLTYTKLTTANDNITKINDAFVSWKQNVEKTKWTSSGFAKAITKYPYWNDENVDYFLFEYDGIPVGLIVYMIINDDIGYQLVNKGIAHLLLEDNAQDKVPDEIQKRIGSFMHHITMKDLHDRGVVDIFAGGAMGIRKASLGVYKKIMNDCFFGVKIYKRNS